MTSSTRTNLQCAAVLIALIIFVLVIFPVLAGMELKLIDSLDRWLFGGGR